MTRSIARLGMLAALLLSGCGTLSVPSPSAATTPGNALSARSLASPSVLQKHLMFFDQNGDGLLTLEETKAGLVRLGLNPLTSLGGAVFIHAGLRKSAAQGLTLDIAKIHMSKHKGDTGAFDAEGRFVPAAFERMFSFDKDHSGSLSWSELKAMIAANKQDVAGTIAANGEFGLLIKVAADTTVADGKEKVPAISCARMQSLYTGTLFYDIASERERGSAKALIEGELPE